MHDVRHLYLIGIGGVGMLWIADWALSQGWQVSGSDLQASSQTERLVAAGANIHIGVDPSAIPEGITEVVINSAITPGSSSYPELEEVVRRGLPVSKRAAWLGKITRSHRTIGVAGTHGKTTTTAMLGWILDRAGLEPTVFVGGSLAPWQGATKIGAGEYLVIEADEFDRSFHNFACEMAILLNLDLDHADYYTGGLPEIRASFRRFLRNLPHRSGLVAAYGRDANLRQTAKGFALRFRWYDEDHTWPGLRLRIPGRHNLLNATAAARIAHELGVDQLIIKSALADFPGVGRRFEYLGKFGRAQVYDDYAHHPKEVAATLQALSELPDRGRCTVVFQPHQKARTKALLAEFARCFDAHPPDRLVIAPIYQVAGREGDIEISNVDLAAAVGSLPNGGELVAPADQTGLERAVEQAVTGPGTVLLMGAGNIRSLAQGWLRS